MARFECSMCGACCTNMGAEQMVLLLRDDIAALAAGQGTSSDDIRREYCETNPVLSSRAGRDITQLRSIKGRCVFLTGDNRCSVHDHKPLQCRIGPDRFLPKAMQTDYDCMRNVDLADGQDLTEHFFARLMEE